MTVALSSMNPLRFEFSSANLHKCGITVLIQSDSKLKITPKYINTSVLLYDIIYDKNVNI